jgi:hypothetical protein
LHIPEQHTCEAGWICEQHPEQSWPHGDRAGHSSTRMLERYTHPTEARKADALGTFTLARVTTASQLPATAADDLADL